MNAEFNWWLLIVGLVVGGGLVWFVLLDGRRRDEDIDAAERPREAAWLARTLVDEGHAISPETDERALRLHQNHLEAPSPADPEPLHEPGASELADDDRLGAEGRPADLNE